MMKFEEKSFGSFEYVIRYPHGFDEGSSKKYPVVLFLHGSGTRGHDLSVLKGNAFFKHTLKMDLPFVTVAPQCNRNSWFDHFETLRDFAVGIQSMNFADPERIYLVGVSMGGYGAWELAMSLPEVFAALIPLCSGGMYWNAGRLGKMPVWAFHGKKDSVVFVTESQKMVEALNKKGNDARLTVYKDNGHNVWDDTFTDPAVFEWMLSQKKGVVSADDGGFRDSKLYG